VINVNLFGYFLVAKHAARVMKAQRSASSPDQFQVGQEGSFKNSRMPPASSADRATQSIALELAEYGVRVNAFAPQPAHSPLWTTVPTTVQTIRQKPGRHGNRWAKYIDRCP